MNYDQAVLRAAILKALAHPVRVLIVDALAARERCVCELNALADIDQSGLSRHLAVLHKAGILNARRDGMKVFYRLECPCILEALSCTLGVIKADTRRKARLLKAG